MATITPDQPNFDSMLNGIQRPLYIRSYFQMPTSQSLISGYNSQIIADTILNGILANHTASGTLGKVISDLATDMTTSLSNQSTIETKIDTIDTNVDAALVNQTNIESKIDTIDSSVDSLPNASAISDAVWDEDLTNHRTSNSAGWHLDKRVSTRARVSDMPSINGIAEAVWSFNLTKKADKKTAAGLLQRVINKEIDLTPITDEVANTRSILEAQLDKLDIQIDFDDLSELLDELRSLRARLPENSVQYIEHNSDGLPVSIVSISYEDEEQNEEIASYETKIRYTATGSIRSKKRTS